MRLSNLLRLEFTKATSSDPSNRRRSTFYVDQQEEPHEEGQDDDEKEMDWVYVNPTADHQRKSKSDSALLSISFEDRDDKNSGANVSACSSTSTSWTNRILPENLYDLGQIGKDGFGVVHKMRDTESGRVMAVKRIRCTMENNEQQRIVENDVKIHAKANSCPFIVTFYDVFFKEGDFWICMELMDLSLKQFYQLVVDETHKECVKEIFLWKVANSTVNALLFLKEQMKIIHRDIKPGNILVNRSGDVKLCDFGAAGRLVDSIAKTRDAGCQPYMAPERIAVATQQQSLLSSTPPQPIASTSSTSSTSSHTNDRLEYLNSIFENSKHGNIKRSSMIPNTPKPPTTPQSYDVRSDVWSLGITLVEVVKGEYPYPLFRSIFGQISLVVDGPAPLLTNEEYSTVYSDECIQFVNSCLNKRPEQRPSYKELMEHPFIRKWRTIGDKMVTEYVQHVLDRPRSTLDEKMKC